MKVKNFELPRRLCQLINSGRWSTPRHGEALSRITKTDNVDDFAFLLPDDMAVETETIKRLAVDPEQSKVYALRSSRKEARPITDRTVLDVDRAVMIAMNWDEQAIFLDYRSEDDEPSVVLSNWTEVNGWASHRRIAANFDDFARRLGMLAA